VIEPQTLSRLVYFVAVAETQAFTRAAARLGITKAVVSQQVARLEAELGTSVFVRTTRRVEQPAVPCSFLANAPLPQERQKCA
jgi:DNA-binding transcriptional LysR family regulator